MKKAGHFTRRADIERIYTCYTPGQEFMSTSALLEFLHKDQMETTANEMTAEGIIDKYEINNTARRQKVMTLNGFLRFMESKDCCIFNQEHARVYQNMELPLSHYFISSSHNTYLTSDQLVGKSHLSAYISALRRGCRCLEIDCWDGPGLEPLVYHGYTLTSKILFRDVVVTVEKHAFEVSPYPLILSLENHCTPPQQVVMANYLTYILGGKLLKTRLTTSTPEELPSPKDLMYKILIKNKKLSAVQGRGQRLTEREDEEGEDSEEEEEQEEEGAAGPSTKIKLPSNIKGRGKKHHKKTVVADELSELVIYTRSVKFVNFSHSLETQQRHENTSLGEKTARRLVKTSGLQFVQHNARFLCRIYPAGSRTLSTNYNPQTFWNVGCQLVALNFQSAGLSMDLNNGRFLDNGGCGYVLKPHFLRSSDTTFNPNTLQRDLNPVRLLLRVISGANLPVSKTPRATNPYVRVEVHGVPSDECVRQTSPVRCDALNPYWDTCFTFILNVPELALIRFSVRDQNRHQPYDFVGQYTVPFTSIMEGYRWVPLLSRDACDLDPASLFISVRHT